MLRTLIVVLAALVCASPAGSDTGAWGAVFVSSQNCTRFEVCRTFTTTGVCTNGADQVVINPVGNVCVSLSLEGSTGAAAANVETSRMGHDAAAGVGVDLFASEVTPTTLGQHCGPLDYLWIDVSANPGSDVDAFITVCGNN